MQRDVPLALGPGRGEGHVLYLDNEPAPGSDYGDVGVVALIEHGPDGDRVVTRLVLDDTDYRPYKIGPVHTDDLDGDGAADVVFPLISPRTLLVVATTRRGLDRVVLTSGKDDEIPGPGDELDFEACFFRRDDTLVLVVEELVGSTHNGAMGTVVHAWPDHGKPGLANAWGYWIARKYYFDPMVAELRKRLDTPALDVGGAFAEHGSARCPGGDDPMVVVYGKGDWALLVTGLSLTRADAAQRAAAAGVPPDHLVEL